MMMMMITIEITLWSLNSYKVLVRRTPKSLCPGLLQAYTLEFFKDKKESREHKFLNI